MTNRAYAANGAACADPPAAPARFWTAIMLPLLMALAAMTFLLAPASAQPIELNRDRPIILPDRPILCSPPRVMRNGRCVMPDIPVLCAPPRVMRNGRCEMPERPAVCLPPRVMREGRCIMPAPIVCPPPQVRRGDRCVMPELPVVCLPPRVMQGGRCVMPAPIVCPPPQVRRGDRCVMPELPVVCLPPRVMQGGRCVMPAPIVCPPPQVRRGDRCVMPERPIVCRPPEVRRGDRCVLPDRPPVCHLPYIYSARERRCILPVPVPPIVTPPACIAPWQYSRAAGGCICPSGYVVDRGECVRRDTQACTFPFVYSSSQNRCVCAQGYRPFGAGCAPERPTPTPQENISWIQACLNAAGYDAGPVDGLTGRRTRDAWTSFRQDSGLGGGEAPYTDPETLAKLFTACNPAEESESGASASDDGDAATADAGSQIPPTDAAPPLAGAFTAAPALCATGRLYSLLRGEQEELEPCGRSCIPAPEGMSEEDLLQQQERQGITWCRSCVAVGSLGMLCPALVEDAEAAEQDSAN
ncbi:peptidoglycan-binding protein [Stappia sp. TSB10GB4]|uniref:peptidoglycan-binding domain-containing protein n=1 Tax=Stappia sp. TSB10GB4 TaxID=2003584 RepID=UPI0016496E3D|nr:peptidoglycan-binding domain-containing protein [Stappia sp. TSB10GB4]